MIAEASQARRLSRSADGRAVAPVRIVHLGLGNFFRAHAAWYTDRTPDAAKWGIAAFTGRTAATAVSLAEQDGLYTLLVKTPDGPRCEVVSSLSAVHAADDLAALRSYLARPEVAIVTLTVTEAGYLRDSAGRLDTSASDVGADIAALRMDPLGAAVTTTPGRLVAGLISRRAADAGPIAIVSNDNIPDNGAMVRQVVIDLATGCDAALPAWIDDHVSVVTTMVDRITPATTDDDREVVAAFTGIDDPETVPTEPFSDWVLAGDFPGGRPAWHELGAQIVPDVRPFEQRKLWLLNGAHSLMAYAGPALGHRTVAEAIADPLLRSWVEQWWDAAGRHLVLPSDDVTEYRQALLERFANPNIRHLLAQIAADGSQKVPIRAVPVIRAGLAAGQPEPGALRLISAWVLHLRGFGAPVTDACEREVGQLGEGTVEESVRRTLRWLDLDHGRLQAAVERQVRELLAQTHRAARPAGGQR